MLPVASLTTHAPVGTTTFVISLPRFCTLWSLYWKTYLVDMESPLFMVSASWSFWVLGTHPLSPRLLLDCLRWLRSYISLAAIRKLEGWDSVLTLWSVKVYDRVIFNTGRFHGKSISWKNIWIKVLMQCIFLFHLSMNLLKNLCAYVYSVHIPGLGLLDCFSSRMIPLFIWERIRGNKYRIPIIERMKSLLSTNNNPCLIFKTVSMLYTKKWRNKTLRYHR